MRKGYLSVSQDKTNYDVSDLTTGYQNITSIVIDTDYLNMDFMTGAMGETEETQAVKTSDLTPECECLLS